MTTQTTTPQLKTENNPFVPIRGESGRLFGMLDTRTGVIHVQRSGSGERDRIDLAKYVAMVKKEGAE